jgi:NADPH:quinone reductase-like Zn-dependent oxidoreductase
MTTAITYDRFGGPDVLTVNEVEAPVPGPGQIQIAVRAAGVNLVDAKLRRGDLAHVFAPHFPAMPGIEAAGVVTALGEGVGKVSLGDEVFGVAANGSYAQLAVLSHWYAKPAQIGWDLAAALPTIGETAFRTLHHLGVQPGETLLIHGAGGGVGSLATQLARARDINVIGTAGHDDLAYVESLGAVAIPYGEELVKRVRDQHPGRIDAVLDASGAGVLAESVLLAGGPERVITIADESAPTYDVRFTGPDPDDRDRTALRKLAALAENDQLRLRIGSRYGLTDARQAHIDMEQRLVRGKLILLAG